MRLLVSPKERSRLNYQENREQIRAFEKEYYKTHKDEIAARKAKWFQDNKEAIKVRKQFRELGKKLKEQMA